MVGGFLIDRWTIAVGHLEATMNIDPHLPCPLDLGSQATAKTTQPWFSAMLIPLVPCDQSAIQKNATSELDLFAMAWATLTTAKQHGAGSFNGRRAAGCQCPTLPPKASRKLYSSEATPPASKQAARREKSTAAMARPLALAPGLWHWCVGDSLKPPVRK